MEILNQVGKWTTHYGESIYGTTASPFPSEFPWGYCTRKGETLYLHVFNWPSDGVLKLSGLHNEIRKAYLLIDKVVNLAFTKNEGDISITLPSNPPDSINSVVTLEIVGEPDVDPFIVKQEGLQPVKLDYSSASTHGRAQKRANRRGESQEFHISRMEGPHDWIEWKADFKSAGTFQVRITYAAISGWEDGSYAISDGTESIHGSVLKTSGWYEYKTEDVGVLKIKEPGITTIRLFPEKELKHYLMYFSYLELTPVEK